jgi:UPF0271 protein
MHIDLNADLGEGYGDDAALLEVVTSANVACGGHAGDAATMRSTLELCMQHGVTVGAHVSYLDREHFGRRELGLQGSEISDQASRQLEALATVARSIGARIHYVKAHGALYNRLADDGEAADAVIAAIKWFDSSLALLTLPDCTAMQRAQSQGIAAVGEAFADRAYRDDGRLLPRSEPGAVLTDAALVAERGLQLVRTGTLSSVSGKSLRLRVRSLCVHGDTPGAAALARGLRRSLEAAGVTFQAFA